MNKLKELIVKRFPKFFAGNLLGTAIDTLVLWLFSHFVFHGYIGQVVISPVISFECAVMTNYVFSYFVTWKDRISQVSTRSFFKRFVGYNATCTGTFILKMGILMLIQWLTKWNVVICNLLALCVSGVVNFLMDNFVVFKKKAEEV